MRRWLSEAAWILSLFLAAYIFLSLITYHYADPGWSHAADSLSVHNRAGYVGAWLADLLLYLFGCSAYWWVVLFFSIAWRNATRLYRQLESSPSLDDATLGLSGSARFLGIQRGVGFCLLLIASIALEAERLHSLTMTLPYAPGGVLGELLGQPMMAGFGFTFGTLALFLLGLLGARLFTGVSWLAFAERIGFALEWFVLLCQRRLESHSDRKIGEQAAERREREVQEDRHRIEEHAPIHIAPTPEIEPSVRVEKEKQAPLFSEMPDSTLPAVNLLDAAAVQTETVSADTLEFTSRLIEKKLSDFGVQVKVIAAYPGPVITRYEIEPATGIKGSMIVNLAKDLARSLSLTSIRVVETIPGKNLMGLELPNPKRQMVKLSEIIGSKAYNDSASLLTMALGKDIAGQPVVADLAKMPHLLVAGTTGSGKSVGINAMILSLLYKADPTQVRLILIDPKMLEMSVYEDIPHLLAPVVTDMAKAGHALNWCVAEMERRYKLMSKLGVRNLAGYNTKLADAEKRGEAVPNPFSLTPDMPEPLQRLPQIVVVIDELADLMMVIGKKIEELIARLAQKARAAGIHLILATQRPSVDVITGLIKANIPTRMAFQVSSKIDSRTILDQMGAETLLGQGDLLYLPAGTGLPQRVHGAFVSDEEVHRVVEHLKSQAEPDYIEGILEGPQEDTALGGNGAGAADAESDPMYDQAVQVVLQHKRASISLVQRHLRIGYNRAARILEQMEKAGLVSAMATNGNREIIAPNQTSEIG
nr:DNA translocase FtsK [Parvibium lacunae]